jgi:hypothetical protein
MTYQDSVPCEICSTPSCMGYICPPCHADAGAGRLVRGDVVVTPPACGVCAERAREFPAPRVLLFRDGRLRATVFACGHWQDEPATA